MSQAYKTYDTLKQDFLGEMDFISNIGVKFFIYPFIDRSKLITNCYYFTYGLLFLTTTQLLVTLCLICLNDFDWFEIINVAPNIGACLMILIKYRKIHDNKELYDEIFKHFRFDLWEAVSDTVEHKKILNRYTQTTRLILRFELYYTIGLAVIVDLFPRIIMVYQNDILGKEKQYLYPFDGWYPFDKKQWYNAAYIWESFMTTVVIFIYVFVNMLHISFTRYICMELKILGSTMEGLISDEDVVKIKEGKDIEKTHNNIRNTLKMVISKHQFLAKITSELDIVLGDGMFLTYAFGSVFICLTAFTATVVDDLYKSMRYFSFFCSLLVEVFFQCIMGQLLIDHSHISGNDSGDGAKQVAEFWAEDCYRHAKKKINGNTCTTKIAFTVYDIKPCQCRIGTTDVRLTSNKLEKAIYFADWVYADSDTKKMVQIFLMRSQKPFEFSAKGYLTMNLDTFSGICSLSYQFFNLLRTAYSE